MSKRVFTTNEQSESATRRRTQRLKLEDAPPINSIHDLIEIGKSIKFYKNLDSIMLWRVTPYLEELDNLIGMSELKESIFYQLIYYIQNMHTRNQEEEYLHTVLIGTPGSGKCIGRGTPVMLRDGSVKPVEDIETGEVLMGDDSKGRTVLSTCVGREKMYKIKQLYGDDYIVNESHILSLKLSQSPLIFDQPESNRVCVHWFDAVKQHTDIFKYNHSDEASKDEAYRKAKQILPENGLLVDISVKDYLSRTNEWKAAFKGYKVSTDWPEKKTSMDPYMVGLWLGDKSNTHITTNDPEIVEYCKKNGFGLRQGKISEKCRGDMYYDNRLTDILHDLNVWGNKHIPKEFLINSREVRMQVLAGLLDANGYLDHNCFEITQTNKQLAKDIIFLARSLGFRATVSECEKSCMYKGKKRSYQHIQISGHVNEIPVKISKKQASSSKINKDYLVYKIELEELEEDNYYGFELDGNHRFLLGDFTVTHNTSVAKILGKIYQAMGILSKNGPFKVAHRDDFIAGYLGQTAIKTQKLLKSCIGGILFVDEIYALGPGQEDKDSFSKEAIDTLNAFLSEHTKDFCCIIAGYEEEIKKCFFAVNQGLESRFPWVHKMDNYSPEDLADIAIKMVGEIKWDLGATKEEIVDVIKSHSDMFTCNGRDIRTFVSKCKMAHARRIISLEPEAKFILTKEDFVNGLEMVVANRHKDEPQMSPSAMYMYM